MNRDQFIHQMTEDFKEIVDLNRTKGKDYSEEDDPFSNFKERAEELGLTPEQIWAVYTSKHWDSIIKFCRDGKVESEPIEGRLKDVILYCFLLLGMVRESS